jgi:hypothetical protein
MVFDLGRAMRKKEEFESARLMDFGFRRRARATRALAAAYGMDPEALVREIALMDEAGLIALVAGRAGHDCASVQATYDRCVAEAHRSLVAERGDPTPHRLS